jgi:hypothetical protein
MFYCHLHQRSCPQLYSPYIKRQPVCRKVNLVCSGLATRACQSVRMVQNWLHNLRLRDQLPAWYLNSSKPPSYLNTSKCPGCLLIVRTTIDTLSYRHRLIDFVPIHDHRDLCLLLEFLSFFASEQLPCSSRTLADVSRAMRRTQANASSAQEERSGSDQAGHPEHGRRHPGTA